MIEKKRLPASATRLEIHNALRDLKPGETFDIAAFIGEPDWTVEKLETGFAIRIGGDPHITTVTIPETLEWLRPRSM